MLTVGKSVGAFEGRNVGLDVVCDGAGLCGSVGASEVAGVGLKVGYSVTGASDGAEVGEAVVGLLVAPNSVGSILTVGKSVGAFDGRNVGLEVVWDGAGLRFSVVGASLGKEANGVGSRDFEGEFVGAADGCDLGNADGSEVGFKSDGFELTDGSALGCRLDSVGSLLPVTVGPGESVGLALVVTVGLDESVGS
jgi:hypothetical protein